MTQTNLARYHNCWYRHERDAFVRFLWYITNALFFINPLSNWSWFKKILLRIFGAEVGKGVVLKPGINIKCPWNLFIGKNTWIGERVWIDNSEVVSIGDNCCLSQGVTLMTGNHNWTLSSFDLIVIPIHIKDGVWLCAGSMVTGGTVCGSHSVLTVHSCATREMEPYSIYRGNPAVKVRERRMER